MTGVPCLGQSQITRALSAQSPALWELRQLCLIFSENGVVQHRGAQPQWLRHTVTIQGRAGGKPAGLRSEDGGRMGAATECPWAKWLELSGPGFLGGYRGV